MESKWIMLRINWGKRLLLLGSILLLTITWGYSQGATVNGVRPSLGSYQRGQLIKIYGPNVFDFNNNNCDSLVFVRNSPLPVTYYRFRSTRTDITYDYMGTENFFTDDTINFTIPCSFVDGQYTLYVYDDEDCDNAPSCNPCAASCGVCARFCTSCGWSSGDVINIAGGSGANNISYGDGIFCVGETPPLPSGVVGVGTYLDLNATGGPTTNAVLNSTTGQLVIHSGLVPSGLSAVHNIQYTSGACLDTAAITIKINQRPIVTYDTTSYCKSLDSITRPTVTGTGITATFTSNPPGMVGLDATNGRVIISPATVAGAYNIIYTPTANSCAAVVDTGFVLTNLDSAIFNYAPTYCNRDANGGYIQSVTALPSRGGYFLCTDPFLQVDSASGRIDLTTPNILGQHIIQYIPDSSSCFVIRKDTIMVLEPLPSNFTAQDSICAFSGTLNCVDTLSIGAYYCFTNDVQFADSVQGIIDVNASTVGGPFQYYRTNGDLACPDTTFAYLTIQLRPDDSISYGALKYCNNVADPLPIYVSGIGGGVFGISGAGVIDSITGKVDLAASPVGFYQVYYQTSGTCPSGDTLASLEVAAAPNASFALADSTFCFNTGTYDLGASASGGTVDTWTVTLAGGLPIVGAITGDTINTNVLQPGGPYAVIRESMLISCQDSAASYIFILPEEDASFVYMPDTFCGSDQNPIPIITGDPGGFYFNGDANALQFDSVAVGMVNLQTSSPGDHHVLRVTGGQCPDSALAFLYIKDALNPEFAYPRYKFCETSDDTLFATYDSLFTPGTFFFHSTPFTPALDSVTGNFVIPNAAADSFVVTMQLVNPQQACKDSFSRKLYIFGVGADSTDFLNYPTTDYCNNEDSINPNLQVVTHDGIFYSRPNNLAWQHRDSGSVDIDHSPIGGYLIFYIKQNACRDTLVDSIHIGAPSNPTLTYFGGQDSSSNTTFCLSDTINPFPRLNLPLSGTYSYRNTIYPQDTLHFFADSTGIVDLTRSMAGSYDITFRESNGCTGSGTQRIRLNEGTTVDLIVEPGDTFCFGTPASVTADVDSFFILLNGVIVDTNAVYRSDSLPDQVIVGAKVIDDLGCISFGYDTLKVYPIPNGRPIIVQNAISGVDSIHFWMGTNVSNTYFTWGSQTEGSVTISPESGTTDTIQPFETMPINVSVALNSSYTPGTVRFLLTPHAAICDGEIDSVTIRINPSQLPIFIPEVFTPDGNNQNDTWKIQWRSDIHPEDYEIVLYNRSGGQVEHLLALTDMWDGASLPDGVYWYVIKSKLGSFVDKGAVTIRRK